MGAKKRGVNKMNLLPEDQIRIKFAVSHGMFIFSRSEHNNFREYEKIKLSELPNKDISLEDFKRFVVNGCKEQK